MAAQNQMRHLAFNLERTTRLMKNGIEKYAVFIHLEVRRRRIAVKQSLIACLRGVNSGILFLERSGTAPELVAASLIRLLLDSL